MSIEQFKGETRFLSSMYRFKVPILTSAGLWVYTAEHVYQPDKFTQRHDHWRVAEAERGIDSKNLAHEFEAEGAPMRENWEDIKLGRMNQIVRDKFFRNPDIAQMLVNTGDQQIVEGNTWEDRYWGVCPPGSDNGENNLGKILMDVRAELQTL